MYLRLAALFVVLAASSSAAFAQDSDASKPITIDAAQLQLIVNVEVASRDAGIIESIGFTEGNAVEQGEVLVKLDQEAEFANASSARSELDIAQEESKNDIDLRFAKVSQDVNRKVYQRSQCDG